MKRKGEGSKPPKPKKNKVDPLQQSLLSFYQPLRGNRQEVQQEVLGNDDDDENTDDDLDVVQQDEGVNGTQEEAERTPFTTAGYNRDRSPPRKRKAKRRRKQSSWLRDQASDDDDDDDDDDDGDRYDEEERDSDREFLAPDDEVEDDKGVFGADNRAQYVICDRATASNDDRSSKSNLSQEVEAEASVPEETPAKSKGASYVVTDVSGFDHTPFEQNNVNTSFWFSSTTATGYDESFVTWPFTCCTMDQMLVNTAAAMRKAVNHNIPGESYFVSNSEGTSSSGYHWFGAVLQISVGGSFEDVVDLGGADD